MGRIEESCMDIYTPPCVRETANGKLLDDTGSLGPLLCDDLEEWDGGGWEGGSRRRGCDLLYCTAETNTTLESN